MCHGDAFNFAFIEIGSTWLLLDKLVYGMLPITTMLQDRWRA